MKREDKKDKLNFLSYFTPYTLERYAKHMKKGEKTHGRGNWQKGGYPKEEYLESAMRHLFALWGEDIGYRKKTSEDHASAVWYNINGYMNEEYLHEDYET